MKKQEGAFNVLKLVATAVVTLHHFQQATGAFFEGHINFFDGNFYWGRVVELFFLMSGYFLYKYSKTSNLEEGFFSFWWKKYKRFLPLLVITGLTSAAGLYWNSVITSTEFSYTLWTCLAGVFGFGRWFSGATTINNPTWYIHVLLICYAVFYLCTYVAKRLKVNPGSAYLLIVLVGIIMFHVTGNYSFVMPFFSNALARGYISFFLGLLLHELLDKTEIHKKPAWLIGCLAYLVAFVMLYVKHNKFVNSNLYYILCFTVFPSLMIVFKAEFLQKLCSAKFFTDLSGITYHTYMWHSSVQRFFINVCQIKNIPIDTLPAMYICLTFVFVVGTLSYVLSCAVTSLHKRKKQPEKVEISG